MTHNIKWAVRLMPVLVFLAAAPAYAATISLSPTTVSVVRGQTVTMNVVVDAGAAQTVTAEAQLSYPSNILTATSFSFAPSWMQLSQPGYDAMGNGTVIKTAGYPGGFTGSKTLGTITFTAQQSGTASVAVLPASQTFGSQGGNTLVAPYGSATVRVGGAAAQTTTTTTGSAVTNINTNTSGSSLTNGVSAATNGGTTVTPATTPVAGASATTSNNSQAAAVATTGAASTVPTWVWIVGALVLLGAIAWGVRSYSK